MKSITFNEEKEVVNELLNIFTFWLNMSFLRNSMLL